MVGAALSASCGSSPASHFYLLRATRTASPAAPEPGGAIGHVLGIGPLRVAGYLKRPQMVLSRRGTELQLDETHRWAEPLDENILAVLTEELAALRPGDVVLAHPWPRAADVQLHVAMDVWRLDVDEQGNARLHAGWQLYGEGGHSLFGSREVRLELPGVDAGDPPAVAEAYSRLLSRLAEAMAASVAEAR